MSEPIKTKKINGKTLNFYKSPYHRYEVDGEKVISVTSITGIINKPALLYWAVGLAKNHLLELLESGQAVKTEDVLEAVGLHKQKKEEAADKGTKIHTWAEEYINALLREEPLPDLPKDDQLANGAMAFMKWISENNVVLDESERLVYSKKYKYAGMADCIGWVDGKKALIDFKTGKAIYNEMRYQVAGYRLAYEEETREKLGASYIIRFDKETADVEIKYLDNHSKDKKAFLGCLAVVNRQKELK